MEGIIIMGDRRRACRPDYSIVWVVEAGEMHEGGRVVGIRRHRTQARVLKAEIQRDKYFCPVMDWCTIRKMTVIDGGIDV